MFHMKKLDNSYRDSVTIGQGAGAVNLQVNIFSGTAPPFRPRGDDPARGEPEPIDLGPSNGGES